MELNEIIKKVTVDSKDNGKVFTVKNRINAIEEILASTEYKLLHKGNLCYVYGKKPVTGKSVVLISSHIDCVYHQLFCDHAPEQQLWKGTFDNSLTNACVLYDMVHGKLGDHVVVAFTGDEEEESGGAYEVARTLRKWNVNISLAIVLDITEEGWFQQQHFTVENDMGIDIVAGHRIIETLRKYSGQYGIVHDSEPDEAYDYDEEEIPCFSLCIPSLGDMHSDRGVLIRENSLSVYCSALSDLANMPYTDSTMLDKTYYVDYEDLGRHIRLRKMHVNEDDCNEDDYVAIREHAGRLELPSMIHGKPVTEIADFHMMGRDFITVRSLVVPNSYKSLGNKNFGRWANLQEVELHCDASAMREWNFAYCNKLWMVRCMNPSVYDYCKHLPLKHSDFTHGCFDGCLEQIKFTLAGQG